MKVATMNSSQTSHVSKGTGAARTWTPDDLPHVQQAAQQIERPKAKLAQDDARIADVANELAKQQNRFAALQKDSADSLQKWVADSSWVDPEEAARAAEMAALQSAIPATSSRLSALNTARSASPVVAALAQAEAVYASACEVARRERETFHRQRVVDRLSTALVDSYAEQLGDGLIRANAKDPLGIIMGMLENATSHRRVLDAVQVEYRNRYGEA